MAKTAPTRKGKPKPYGRRIGQEAQEVAALAEPAGGIPEEELGLLFRSEAVLHTTKAHDHIKALALGQDSLDQGLLTRTQGRKVSASPRAENATLIPRILIVR